MFVSLFGISLINKVAEYRRVQESRKI